MVVGIFPAAKLGVLFFKQISKPVANIIKNKAKQSPFFRQYICMPPAQFYNWVEIKTKMWAMNLGKPTNIPQLNEAMAIELGANLLGEIIIFTIGAGLLILEYARQLSKETSKEENNLQEKKELQNTLCELALQLERQDAQIREMARVMADLESKSWFPKKLLPSLGSLTNANDTSNDKKLRIILDDNNSDENETTRIGNYDPNDGLLFKSLNMIENEFFYRPSEKERKNGILVEALISLGFENR